MKIALISDFSSVLFLRIILWERYTPHLTGGATDTDTQACLTSGAEELGSCVQGPLLLREFRGVEFRRGKGSRGTGRGSGQAGGKD